MTPRFLCRVMRTSKGSRRGESGYLESLMPKGVGCPGEVLNEGPHEVFEPDEAVNIPLVYLPAHDGLLWLLQLLDDRLQVLLV